MNRPIFATFFILSSVAVGVIVRAMPQAPASSNATGCAPGTRCISVDMNGAPNARGGFVAQCRGKFADFIVNKGSIPSNYMGPWFTPEWIETATTNGPTGNRPWLAFNPAMPSQRLQYLLALRNYAYASSALRSYTPQLTNDSSYFDPMGGTVAPTLRTQKWYPAPRMFYQELEVPGVREASHGMTQERFVARGELAGNTQGFVNYAVAYYDVRGAHTFQQTWSTATPGVDGVNISAMQIAEGGFAYKLLFSPATSNVFPQDILQNSVTTNIIPKKTAQSVPVRLLQIDIAVKDNRAGVTGWYFATYAYDRSITDPSPWRRMVPVGLMWGNDPNGPPLMETWVNPAAPAYARMHLGEGGRLNGPVDNPVSACMSCHSTAQAPSIASMFPRDGCAQAPFKASWFRNLRGSQAFGRFTSTRGTNMCVTTPPATAPTAADYSLQLSATVSDWLAGGTVNPCTWDSATPVPTVARGGVPPAAAVPLTPAVPTFKVER